jgi:hypothetical protein
VGWDIVRRETNQGGGGEEEGAPTRGPRGTASLTKACRRRHGEHRGNSLQRRLCVWRRTVRMYGGTSSNA